MTLRRRILVGATALASIVVTPAAVAWAQSQTPDAKTHAALQPVGHATNAFTYDPAAPRGATAHVEAFYLEDDRTVVSLEVRGLQPFRTYGAHAHVGSCTSNAAASGGHWDFPDSTAPHLEHREIWLDLTTDERGYAKSVAVRDEVVPQDDRPMSVVVHANPTDATSGAAGARLACVTVPF